MISCAPEGVWHWCDVAAHICVVKVALAPGLWWDQDLVLLTDDDKNVGLVALTGKRRGRTSPAHISHAIFFPLYDSKLSCKAGRKEGRREGRAAVCICHHCQQRMTEQVVPGGITSGLSKTCSRLPGKWYFSCNDFAFIRNKALPRALLPSGRWIAPLVSLMSRDGFNKMFCFKGKKPRIFFSLQCLFLPALGRQWLGILIALCNFF